VTRITSQNLLKHELIGLAVRVVNSAHPGYVGISGMVINETKNMLLILHEGKPKSVPKKPSVFQFSLPDGALVEVGGVEIAMRPEDRIEKAAWRKS
jgi:ribonuclease P protein subunit POP4